uniref:Uncharacterized protein n=1 Tax=Romanomermis culicivorax TaxID=13658 RepID=A0A915L062_ROMCU
MPLSEMDNKTNQPLSFERLLKMPGGAKQVKAVCPTVHAFLNQQYGEKNVFNQ